VEKPVVYMSDDEIGVFNLADLYRPLSSDEVFDKQDVRYLIRNAIGWWQVQLNTIEQSLAK